MGWQKPIKNSHVAEWLGEDFITLLQRFESAHDVKVIKAVYSLQPTFLRFHAGKHKLTRLIYIWLVKGCLDGQPFYIKNLGPAQYVPPLYALDGSGF